MDIESYATIAPQYYSNMVPEMLESYLLKSNATTYLDCGCGDGNLLYSLQNKRLLNNKEVYGVDLSENRVDIVKSLNSEYHITVDSVEDLRTIPDNIIDFLSSTQVIEHVDDEKMLTSVNRVLSDNGVVYLTTVYKKWYGWYFYRNGGRWVLDPTHIREYAHDDELISLVDKCGFVALENKKTMLWFPVIDFIVKRLHIKNRKLYENKVFSLIRRISVPIIGYYNWELILVKNNG